MFSQLELNSRFKQIPESISFDARQLIYDVMLQRLSIVQKLNVQCRLARDILQHAADMTDEGDEELSPELNAALLDAITLLCGPRMKLPSQYFQICQLYFTIICSWVCGVNIEL